MPKISQSQLEEMENTLDLLMNMRLKLTKIVQEAENNEDMEETINDREKISSKYDPPITFKEHFLSHLTSDISNLAPLPLLNTDLFESIHPSYKTIRVKKRSSVNVLHTLITNHEKLSVYHSSNDIIPPHNREKY